MLLLLLFVWLWLWPMATLASDGTLSALQNLLQLRQSLQTEQDGLNQQLAASISNAEKEALKKEMAELEQNLRSTQHNFEDLAAGARLAALAGEGEQQFNLQTELLALLRPALEELKGMTSQMRKKADLKERIDNYARQLPVIEQALTNLTELKRQAEQESLRRALAELEGNWLTRQAMVRSELQTAQLQLQAILEQEISFSEASQNYLKTFFQQRGLYLGLALLVVVGIGLLSRLNHYLLRRFIPGFSRPHRSFRVRLIELIHFVGTLLLMVLGPMLVFYMAEDWVLLSLSILVLLAMALTLRHTLPQYIQQIQLFLNIGTVREGERLQLDGLPWLVRRINVYSVLENPDAGLSLRVHIDKLVGLRSRALTGDEAWFPCRPGDWVILADGVRAQVTGISEEWVVLRERGGAQVTYATAEFIAARPRNLSVGFRLKEVIGLSYALQAEIVAGIPARLAEFVQAGLVREGYGDSLLAFRVELGQAGNSSLDLVMIADFSGEVAELYGRLGRALQRLAVAACQQQGWEIPFPQLTLHGVGGTGVAETG